MLGNVKVDAVCQPVLIDQTFEVDGGGVREEEENSRDDELLVPIAVAQPVGRFGRVAQVNKGLSGSFVEQESIR